MFFLRHPHALCLWIAAWLSCCAWSYASPIEEKAYAPPLKGAQYGYTEQVPTLERNNTSPDHPHPSKEPHLAKQGRIRSTWQQWIRTALYTMLISLFITFLDYRWYLPDFKQAYNAAIDNGYPADQANNLAYDGLKDSWSVSSANLAALLLLLIGSHPWISTRPWNKYKYESSEHFWATFFAEHLFLLFGRLAMENPFQVGWYDIIYSHIKLFTLYGFIAGLYDLYRPAIKEVWVEEDHPSPSAQKPLALEAPEKEEAKTPEQPLSQGASQSPLPTPVSPSRENTPTPTTTATGEEDNREMALELHINLGDLLQEEAPAPEPSPEPKRKKKAVRRKKKRKKKPATHEEEDPPPTLTPAEQQEEELLARAKRRHKLITGNEDLPQEHTAQEEAQPEPTQEELLALQEEEALKRANRRKEKRSALRKQGKSGLPT